MAQAVPNLSTSRKVFLKHQLHWNTVCEWCNRGYLPWRNICSADNPGEVLILLVGRCVPTKVIYMCHKVKPWFDD